MSPALLIPAEHPIQWVTASPLWDAVLPMNSREAAADELPMRRPALLRFASDTFMDDLEQLLDSDPSKLAAHRARPETYRMLPPGRKTPATLPPLKLFQPAHGHFNLVAATLVCRRPGLPEHLVDAARDEAVAFVLRRLDATDHELAWVPGPTPPENEWTRPEDPSLLEEGEELLPMFPMKYSRQDRQRRLFVGLVPTSSTDSFRNQGPLSIRPTPEERGGPEPDPRAEELKVKVRRPLEQLQDISLSHEFKPEASRFLLVDLAGWIYENFGADGAAILAGTAPSGAKALALWNGTLSKPAHPDWTWAAALKDAWRLRDAIWGETDEDASSFTISLDHPVIDDYIGALALEAALIQALPPAPSSPPPRSDGELDPEDVPIPKLDPRGTARYVVRCVYLRPACGALHDDVISEPSERFQIASFFDLDAPARPIQIVMPLNTSIGDLAKVPKGVRVLLSDELRAQLSKAAELSKLMNGKTSVDEGPPTLGMMCGFSIPIIAICALFLLMIIVFILNLIFWWLPRFRICWPIFLKAGK